MKTCPACGLHVEDDYIYCWEDGTRLSGVETRVLPQRSTALMTPEEPATPFLAASEAAGEHRVLSCPVCSGEFPLTFSACPVHDLPLTSKRVSRVRALAVAAPTIEEPLAQVLVSDEALLPQEPIGTNELDFSDESPGLEESDASANAVARGPARAGVFWAEVKDRARALRERITSGGYASRERIFGLSSFESQRRPAPPPGMRLAARATAIALALFALGALYLFYRQVTRRPTRSAPAAAARSGSAQVAQAESPLIATPPEARDYREEPAPAAQEPADAEAPPNQTQKQTIPYRGSNDAIAPRMGSTPPDRSVAPTQPATQASGMPETVQSTASGRFNAQLVRVRSYKAASGYSYTLTFTLFEHTGRPMKWERLSIVTHSASGATHTDMIPFQHWLAGSGALTFTLNVDMAGPSEDDWRGRISCMSVGADETGRPLRASFGTNVAP